LQESEFRRLVADYEHTSRHDPQRFVRATAAMAALGYVVILALLTLAALGLAWGAAHLWHGQVRAGTVLLVVLCASLLLSLLRALWMRQAVPQGLAVTAREAPRLFELIEKIRRRTGAPRVHRVLIDGELNAAIVQQPRLGLLGWHRNHLILGLPLMMGLDLRQLAAVIAHEFGHLEGAHGKLGAWVYRTRRSWFMLALAREQASMGASVADLALGFFFRHFFPRFNARAFVLSRQQEYEADRVAHRIVGTQPAADALMVTELQGRYLAESFWPGVDRRAAAAPTPQGERPYHELHRALRSSLTHPHAAAWLKEASKRLPDPADTHPALRDRLEFAAVAVQLPAPAKVSAAEALLREALPPWIERMDAHWREQVATRWTERHRQLRGLQRMVEELQAELAQGPLDPDDHLLWARAALQTAGPAAEELVLRRMLRDHPDHLAARYQLGLTLIESEDADTRDEGAALLRAVAEAADDPWALAAAQRRERWLQEQERFAELGPWRARVKALQDRAGLAWDALNDFDGTPHFEPCGLSRRTLRPLQDLMRAEKAVGRAFVVRKLAVAAQGWRFCIVIVERSRVLGQPDAKTWWMDLRDRIDLPCPFMVIDLAHPFWKDPARAALVAQMTAPPQACVYGGRRV
jgi:Zn-dependent protease with chaperone function